MEYTLRVAVLQPTGVDAWCVVCAATLLRATVKPTLFLFKKKY